MKIIKMHMGLIRYINQEIKKKKTIKQHVLFFKNLALRYYKINLQEYRNLFKLLDLDYQKQLKQQKKLKQAKKDVYNAWKIIQYMINAGKDRTERKQIRRDFEKYGRMSREMERAILKDIYGLK